MGRRGVITSYVTILYLFAFHHGATSADADNELTTICRHLCSDDEEDPEHPELDPE